MYVDSMNADEIKAEYVRDLADAAPFLEHKISNDFRRALLKAKTFPVVKLYDWKSPRKNKYIVKVLARNKNGIKKGRIDTEVSLYAILPDGSIVDANDRVNGQVGLKNGEICPCHIKIIIPHVLARYKERFGLLPQYKSVYHQLAHRLYSSNGYISAVEPGMFQTSHGQDAEVLMIWGDGLFFGTTDMGDKIVLKTYLSFGANFTEKQKSYLNDMSEFHLRYDDYYKRLNSEISKEIRKRAIR